MNADKSTAPTKFPYGSAGCSKAGTFKTLAAVVVFGGLAALAGCSSQADTVSKNLSAEADSFNVERRVVFVNGITDKAILTIEGKCSINDSGSQLEVTCKVGPDAYKKHFLGRSDNMTYFAEQIEANNVDPFHYKVVIRPESLVPNPDVQTSGG